jgi:hypothetical protein
MAEFPCIGSRAISASEDPQSTRFPIARPLP